MIAALIRWSIVNRFLVLLATVIVTAWGLWAVQRTPLDALPDLSDTQVIVYSRWDRSPDIIEDQVTYPLSLRLQGLAGIRAVRSSSEFNFSFFPPSIHPVHPLFFFTTEGSSSSSNAIKVVSVKFKNV